ncbi:MAG: hypothetical protein IJO73_07480 [Clostridia bacterium]|nr:hypothetical protein [Clostridia bacterium]
MSKPLYRITEKQDVYKNAKVKFTPDGFCKVSCFTRQIYKGEGYEALEFFSLEQAELELQAPPKKEVKEEKTDRIRQDSFKRSKNAIFEIAAANVWKYMVTFTVDKDKCDRYDREAVKKAFSGWLYDMAKRKGLKALIIPEYHKDKAIHFHGLINDSLEMVHSSTYKIEGEKKPVKESTLRKRGLTPQAENVKDVYNVKGYKLGFSTAVPLDGNVTRVSYYMTKYCTKDLEKIFGSYYFCVGKVKRHLPYQICNMDFEHLKRLGNSVTVDLPENLGQVVYATITLDDFEGCEIL